MRRMFAGRIAFVGYHGCSSLCWVQAYEDPDRPSVVIASELPQNPGTSVTNACEHLATTLVEYWGLDPESLLWFEHYPSSRPGIDQDRLSCWERERFKLVEFRRVELVNHRFVLAGPTWSPRTREQVEHLIRPAIFEQPEPAVICPTRDLRASNPRRPGRR